MMTFSGCSVALVTPMLANGDVDFAALQRLVAWHIQAGTQALVILGTTGEAPTLTKPERQQIIEAVVAQARGQIPIMVGTGSNATAEAIALSRQAEQLGADACLVVTPYYNKPTQEGLFRHYSAVAEAVTCPVMLYNVPGRTRCDLLPPCIARLAAFENIIGVKDATGDIERGKQILASVGDDFLLLSGDDATAFALMEIGAHGMISITANVVPTLMAQLAQAALQRDWAVARASDASLQPLHQTLVSESNPIPCKWLLHDLGLIDEGIRLPLTPLSEALQAPLRQSYQVLGLTD